MGLRRVTLVGMCVGNHFENRRLALMVQLEGEKVSASGIANVWRVKNRTE